MNEVLKCLLERRSVKKYQSTPIEREKIEQVLEAGTYAANGRGLQSPIIIAITEPGVRNELSRLNGHFLKSTSDPFYGAPVVLAVLADRTVPTWKNDGSLVIGNMLSAAYSLGLGSCWIHRAKEVFESERGQALLSEWGIEGDYEGVGFCILGYKEGESPKAKERKAGYVKWVE